MVFERPHRGSNSGCRVDNAEYCTTILCGLGPLGRVAFEAPSKHSIDYKRHFVSRAPVVSTLLTLVLLTWFFSTQTARQAAG